MYKLLALCLVVVLVPAVAFGGKTAVEGNNTLKLEVTPKPAKTGKRISLRLQLKSGTVDGERQEDVKALLIDLDRVRINNTAVPRCDHDDFHANPDKPAGDPSRCPAGSKVGEGTALMDTRPLLPDPVEADLTIFNGTDGGKPRLLVVAEALGVTTDVPFKVEKKGARLFHDYGPDEDPDNPQLYSIAELDIKIGGGTKKRPYLKAKGCPESWIFGFALSFYSSPEEPLVALDEVKCKVG